MKTIHHKRRKVVSSSPALRELIGCLHRIEQDPSLPNDAEAWLDEDYPFLTHHTRQLVESTLWHLDPALADKEHGGVYLPRLTLLARVGFSTYLLPYERAVIRTVKGRILVTKPF